MADSLKERVKRAGGAVEGVLCCRLAWDYTDDLDFHMQEPKGTHIYYPMRRTKSAYGGELDVDANGADGQMAQPVENIYYADERKLQEGLYLLWVNNYQRRSEDRGFEVELEFGGQKYHMAYDKALRTQENVAVATLQYTKAKGFEILESLKTSTVSKSMWGLATQAFHRVNVAMLSPNYWWDQVSETVGERRHGIGNKHYFFMLDGCVNEGQARGFFNEFLDQQLDQHRKVFEMVGAKMKTDNSDRQLSGLGFSSTQRNSVLCRVQGKFQRVVRVVF